MPQPTSSRTSSMLVVLVTIVLMLISGAGGYLALRESNSSNEAELGPLATRPRRTTTTVGGSVTTEVATVFVLDAPAFTVTLPTAPSASDNPTTWNGTPVAGTRWVVEAPNLVVTAYDYSQAATVGGFDVQQVLDSIVVGRAVEGSTVVANESITIGVDMGRRARIEAADYVVLLTAVFHGTTLAVVEAQLPVGGASPEYDTAVASLVWK